MKQGGVSVVQESKYAGWEIKRHDDKRLYIWDEEKRRIKDGTQIFGLNSSLRWGRLQEQQAQEEENVVFWSGKFNNCF